MSYRNEMFHNLTFHDLFAIVPFVKCLKQIL